MPVSEMILKIVQSKKKIKENTIHSYKVNDVYATAGIVAR